MPSWFNLLLLLGTLTFDLGSGHGIGICSTADVHVLCIFTVNGAGQCSTIHTLKLAVLSAKRCCTATTVALTSIKPISGP